MFVIVFLNWCLIYQTSTIYKNYYAAVIDLCLIENFVLKGHLKIFIKNIWLGLCLVKIDCEPFKCQPHRVVKHSQTVCQFYLRIYLSVYDLFWGGGVEGVVIKELKMSILTFFSIISILMHCCCAFFFGPNVIFY